MAQIRVHPIPPVKKDDVTENYFGMLIDDPYRWLEDDNSEETAQWVNMQNEVSNGYFKSIPHRETMEEELTHMWNYAKIGTPSKKGGYYFYRKNDGLQNQSVLYYQEGLDGEPQVFIDPNKLDESGTSALGAIKLSQNKKYCSYAVSKAGSDWSDIYVMDVKTRKKMSDHLSYVKFSNMAWIGEDGFYYSGYDRPKDVSKKFSAKTEFQKIFYHKIGTDQSEDKLIYEDREHAQRYKWATLTEDKRWLILNLAEGTDGSEVHYWDLHNKKQEGFKMLLKGFDYNYSILDNIDGKFYVYTNHGAPNYRVVKIDPLQPQKENWVDLIKEKEEKLDEVNLVGGKILCSYLKDASSLILVHDMNGNFQQPLDLPGIGTASGFGGTKMDQHTFYSFTSFNSPPTIYKYFTATGISQLYKAPRLKFEPGNMVVKQEWFESKDGTKVPMFIVHRDDLDLSKGPHPVLMYGYGGFNIPLTPSFSIPNAYFVQKGGIYVMVNLRGGSEFGEKWHEGGMLSKKQNVFDDFIGAAEYLIKKKITSKDKLAISGRSNGGLLVGACMTQRPDLFKVALPAVGVLDMLRYHKFTVGWGWVVEYGSSANEEDFDYLIKYSPLHNIYQGKDYPCTLITTADHDDRVVPAHSFKFAATLQEKNSGKNPILIRIDKEAGHGAGKPTSKIIEEYADILSFTMYHLGMKPYDN